MQRFFRTLLTSFGAALLIVIIRVAIGAGSAMSWHDMTFVALATGVIFVCFFVVDLLFALFTRKQRDGVD